MLLSILTPLLFLSLTTASPEPQLAQGGGLAPTTVAIVQYPVVTSANSLFTANGKTSANFQVFTQTFASTALGTWDIGATPLSGSIGLGSIQGAIGAVKTKTKRGLDAIETPV